MTAGDFLIVGIGASAGGIKAIKQFFERVPPETGIAFVVILHLSPEHESHLAEVLQLSAALPVMQVQDRVRVEPDRVYVIPPNQSLSMLDGHLSLSEMTRIEERRAPVDVFFRTLADSHHSRAVSVILSGTGANGSMGMKRVKELGGVCFVQDPEEAEYGDMPRNAIATALVDDVLPVAAIPARIIAYKESLRSVQIPEEPIERGASDGQALRDIFTQLRTRTGHDFSNYKHVTVFRRIARRMGVQDIPDLSGYAEFLRQHPSETQALLKDLLISVTNFFRDHEAFDALEQKVIPRLFERKTDEDQVRVWVAGCATGEEAYSIAMLLREFGANATGNPHVQVFASDIDESAIAVAREGLYTLNDAADVSPERLRRFFIKEGEAYRVRNELREMVLFARHNVIKDPPFSHLDLVCCRNLLIYLNRLAQHRVMETVHFALNPGGFLFVGSSESTEGATDLFGAVDGDAHIFQSRPLSYRPGLPVPDLSIASRVNTVRASSTPEAHARERLSSADLHLRLLEQYAPPSVVITDEHEIVHLSEGAGAYLQFSGGNPSHNLLRSILPDLRLELRTALYQAAQQRTNVDARGLTIRVNERTRVIDLLIRPVLRDGDPARGFFLVVFEETDKPPEDPPLQAAPVRSGDAARQLEEEIVRVKGQLRIAVEQYETQTEELGASNEELQAMNEELRSSGEELETSKEELQSLNEELRTVNQELKIKVEEQAQANDDMQNLINSTEIGTVFLDRASRIKFFTPRARDVFNLIPADRGRPLSDINSMLVDADLAGDVERVLDRLERVEREVQTRDERWQLMRALPYRTSDDRIDGVVLTFVDITARKNAENRLRASEQRLRRATEIESVGVIFFDGTRRITEANDAFLRMTGYSRQELERGTLRWDDVTPLEWTPATLQAFDQLAATGRTSPYENEYLRKDGKRFWALSAATRLDEHEMAGVVVDLTARKRVEERLHRSETGLRLILESVTNYAIFTIDPQGRIESWNNGAARIFGYPEEEILGQPFGILFTPDDRARGADQAELIQACESGQSVDERWHVRKDGSRFFVSAMMNGLRGGQNELIGYVKIARDLTEHKHWEDALRSAQVELESRVEQRTSELADANASLDSELRERRQAEERVRALLGRLMTVQEDERRRIARDLHDHLGQQVAGLSLSMQALETLVHERDDLRKRVQDAQAVIGKLDRDLDFFTWELRPPVLDDLGVPIALEHFVREWSRNFGIRSEFHTRGFEKARLTREIETSLYRIAQEALNNIYKHAQAERVAVLLERRGQEVVLVIEDDGRGFDRSRATTNTETAIGLIGMDERASLVGGTLEIETEVGRGTTVFVRIPLAFGDDERSAAGHPSTH
jgi:two-component system, chemotaxis family, CheB/CheR fusion protein